MKYAEAHEDIFTASPRWQRLKVGAESSWARDPNVYAKLGAMRGVDAPPSAAISQVHRLCVIKSRRNHTARGVIRFRGLACWYWGEVRRLYGKSL